ncbi:hypothetical protein [Marinobacterium stanieri]|uniref:Uncharacterized protein n=1 Tax=Marinobacterium stanieri TaxID=49186 RepID=A0A1N6RNT2_9GAMM|nr:hypothetical protein [Marinobacterium stanieri]SIQ30459.1 hypothetical protein SAMN05421647_103438 [Marinobacterium stanieri]
MELDVDGINNRVAGRDFYQIHNAHGRLLTKDERKELNDRVQALFLQYEEPPWETWRTIHRVIGVEGAAELRLDHRDQVGFILDLLEERGDLKSRLNVTAEPESHLRSESETPEHTVSRGGVISWMMEFPEYSGLLFIAGITFGVVLGMV